MSSIRPEGDPRGIILTQILEQRGDWARHCAETELGMMVAMGVLLGANSPVSRDELTSLTAEITGLQRAKAAMGIAELLSDHVIVCDENNVFLGTQPHTISTV